ncbi:MAG: alpha amylase C-terminal domain-containing protein, partial [Actinomycetota bacterium]|nr:alpha amylase C-terminal domain-containing protein [Actinomycetota bacterium]
VGYQMAQPGKKLLFMGGELGQGREWNHDAGLDWGLLEVPWHRGIQRWVRDLNRFYRETPAMFELDADPSGFEWIDANDSEGSSLAFLRRSATGAAVAAIFNFTPVPRPGYGVGLPWPGPWEEALNSDAGEYEGSGVGNMGGVTASEEQLHGRPASAAITLPPLGCVFLRSDGPGT